MPTATTPTVNKMWIAVLLTMYRERAGLSQMEAGVALYPRMKENTARAKIAQIEAAQANFKAKRELEAALDLYEVAELDVREWLLEAFDHTSQLGRWKGPRASFGPDVRKLIDLEQDADQIRVCASEIMPGLLQGPGYVRALFTAYGKGMSDEDIDLSVEARLSRAQTTFMRTDNPARVLCVLSQSCFERFIGTGSRKIMREQMVHLLDLTSGIYPHLMIRIIPWETPHPPGATSITNFSLLHIPSFGLAGPREIAYSENPDPRYMDDPADVTTYESRWELLAAAAMSPNDTRRMIDEFRLKF